MPDANRRSAGATIKPCDRGPGAPLEVYNLTEDIGEQKNLAATNPELVQQLEKMMKDVRTDSEHFPLQKTSRPPGKKVKMNKRGTIKKTNWKLVKSSSENHQNDKFAKNVFDGNPATLWHSQWQEDTAKHPHELIIDLGKTYKIKALRHVARQDGGTNGMVKGFEITIANDINDLDSGAIKGAFKDSKEEQEFKFPFAKSGRYFKLKILSSVHGDEFGSIAEINLVGK